MLKKFPLMFDRTFILVSVVLPIIHIFLIQIVQKLAFENGVLVIWPSTGIYLAAVLLWGHRIWPAILLSELLGNSLVYGLNPIGLTLSGVDLIDPLLIAFMIHQWIGSTHWLERSQKILTFVGIVLIEPILTTTLGVTAISIGGLSPWNAYLQSWQAWWLSIVIGILIVTPALLVWHPRFAPSKANFRSQVLEFALLLLLVAAIAQAAFGQGYPLEYMLLPVLMWSAFRFTQRETTLLIVVVSAIAIWGTVQGYGSFVRSSATESLILLQSFVGVVTLVGLVLSAVLSEIKLAELKLKRANEDLEQRVEERTAELKNTLRELQLTQNQIVQTEKMSSLGQLVAGIAHEINNPINFIHGNLTHVQNYADDLLDIIQGYEYYYPEPPTSLQEKIDSIELDFLSVDLTKILQSMRMGTDRIRQIVLSLRNFSRLDEAEIKPVNLHEGIDNALVILGHRLKAKFNRPAIQITKEYAALPLVECYAGQMNQVFMNILVNAIDALEETMNQQHWEMQNQPMENSTFVPYIRIHTESIDTHAIRVAIADNGLGMTQDLQQHIFDPFFTTKPVGKGTGMGMSISYQIVVEKHGGKLYCHSTPNQGTEMVIEIPIKSIE
jgi:signal transduction histidine kinase